MTSIVNGHIGKMGIRLNVEINSNLDVRLSFVIDALGRIGQMDATFRDGRE